VNATREEWRPVVGYEDSYEVSDLGRVRSITRPTHNGIGRPILGGLLAHALVSKRKYPSVTLYRDGAGKAHRVHRLVLDAFVGPCPEGMESLHANDIASDNRLSNLRWGTRSDNAADTVSNGNNPNANKTHCIREHQFTTQNTRLTSTGSRECRECDRQRAAFKRERNRSNPTIQARNREYQRAWMREYRKRKETS
jgi:HNH endonuclease/NUMOD4 motif